MLPGVFGIGTAWMLIEKSSMPACCENMAGHVTGLDEASSQKLCGSVKCVTCKCHFSIFLPRRAAANPVSGSSARRRACLLVEHAEATLRAKNNDCSPVCGPSSFSAMPQPSVSHAQSSAFDIVADWRNMIFHQTWHYCSLASWQELSGAAIAFQTPFQASVDTWPRPKALVLRRPRAACCMPSTS